MRGRLACGTDWERAAEEFLRKRGLQLLHRNYRVRRGEIDLVMREGDTLVFVEVRFRGSGSRGTGAESVTRPKQQRILHAARHYLHQADPHARFSCRFDVISIDRAGGRTVMNWIRGACDAG